MGLHANSIRTLTTNQSTYKLHLLSSFMMFFLFFVCYGVLLLTDHLQEVRNVGCSESSYLRLRYGRY